jgi:hypothetical protein
VAKVSAIALATALAMPAAAKAELTQRGNLFVSFEGGIAPNALPRDHLVPIAVEVAGRVRTLSGERPPALREIRIELNRAGHLDTKGLPICRRAQIEVSTSEQALAACRGALVGTGAYAASASFPEQSTFPANGRILAFNSRADGKSAILAHVYGTHPAPNTRIVVFGIERRAHGTYGTVLHGALPASINRWGYLKRISLRLHRVYRHRGRTRSYVSAACEAPPGFPGASFAFARARMRFADGRRLSSTLTRSCAVRGDPLRW